MRVMGTTNVNAFSGEDDGIFQGLRARSILVDVIDGQLPFAWRTLFLATSFRPNKYRWYCAWHHKMVKNPAAFRARTRSVDRRLRRRLPEFDVVLQVGGLFASFRGDNPKPVTLFCDYTTKLAELNYPLWFGMSKRVAEEWYALETALYQSCAMVFTASQNTRASLVQHYAVDPSRARVVGLGVHEVYEHPAKSYDESTILLVGIDFERKGGPTVLRAFAKVRKHLPRAKLVIVGPRAEGSQEGVVWLGYLPDRKQLHQLFSEATVVALPSVCEPFGFALIEGMSHGLPVVGSYADAMPEIIEEGQTGYLVPAGEADALADRLICLLSSPDICARMGSAGRARVVKQFLWKQVVQRIEEGLREVHQGSEFQRSEAAVETR